MIKLVFASVLALAAINASAQMYGEIGVTSVNYDETVPGLKFKSSPTAIRGILGYEINPNFAVEGLVGFGMSDDNLQVNGIAVPGAKFKASSIAGIYAKPKAQFTPELEGFVRAGFAQSRGTVSVAGVSASSSTTSFLTAWV